MKRLALTLKHKVLWIYRWVAYRLRNRYFRVAVLSGVWMLFFDRYDVSTLLALKAKVADLSADKAYYETEIVRLRRERAQLDNNLREVERIAREAYLMKRPDEEIYILEYTD